VAESPPSIFMTFSNQYQSAFSELNQELALKCCEVVLKKRNAETLLDLVNRAEELVSLLQGDTVGSIDDKAIELREALDNLYEGRGNGRGASF
jgi:hypothetical protein